MQPYGSEGSDGLASPDDRDEAGTESDLLASANGELKIKKKDFFSFFSFSLCIYIYMLSFYDDSSSLYDPILIEDYYYYDTFLCVGFKGTTIFIKIDGHYTT